MLSSKRLLSILSLFVPLALSAQVGEHRNEWTVGVSGGVNLSSISFLPKVPQGMNIGKTGGLMLRYKSEKYFSTICSVQGEINYSQIGWNEEILDKQDQRVLADNGLPQKYQRSISYIQVPILAHLAWGKERNGLNYFFNAGPQFGYYLSESTESNLNYYDDGSINTTGRVSSETTQTTMPVENKFDYGIAAGLGLELSIKSLGRIQLEGRYYYGLANIYGDTKRDYFATSNHSVISVRLAYLFDLNYTK